MAVPSIAQNLNFVKLPPANLIREQWQGSDLVQRLRLVFDNIDDTRLMWTLEDESWRGRRGYSTKVLWRSLLAGYVLGVGTVTALIRQLHENPFLAHVCEVTSVNNIPSKYAYSTFVTRLVDHNDLVRQCMAGLAVELGQQLPDFGEIVAADSTDISAWSNGSKKPASDPDATWSAKRARNGAGEWWFGYKVHLLCDATHEIPITFNVTTGARHDSKDIIPLLEDAVQIIPKVPQYVLADAGYDAKRVYREIIEDFGAIPVIKLNLHGKKPDDIYDELTDWEGKPYCKNGFAMVTTGFDESTGELIYGCPELLGQAGCIWLDKCPDPGEQEVRINISDDYRRFCQVARGSREWDILYNLRGSVERVFGRLKGFRALNYVTLRGLEKVELHCLLSVIVMQAMALGKAKQGSLFEIRSNVRKVA